MRATLPFLLAMVVAGCGSEGPTVPLPDAMVGVHGLEVTASAGLDGDSLRVRVTIANATPRPVAPTLFGGNCELLLRLYRQQDGQGVLVLNEAFPGVFCQDVGGEVHLDPGESAAIEVTRPLSRLGADGVRGPHVVVAVLPQLLDARMVPVTAGLVVFP